jgi:hypothetical protein
MFSLNTISPFVYVQCPTVAKAEYKQEVSTVSNTEHKQKVILYLN